LFEQVLGLPAHPLLVHAAVVFVPLLVVGALVYALVPLWRVRVRWAVTLLALVGPLCATFAKLSGDAFRSRLLGRGASGPILDKITQHKSYGDATMWSAIALGAVVLVLVYLTSGRRPLDRDRRQDGGESRPAMLLYGLLIVITAGLALVNAFYVFKTGDSGARMVWEGS
jgi:uncharacterized membrane protein